MSKLFSLKDQQSLDPDNELVQTIVNYKLESDNARRDRMDWNKKNYDMYHLRQDYSHKRRGQSTEFLPKQMMAVEQISSFMHQGLVDLGKWFSIEPRPGKKESILDKDEASKLLMRQLEKTQFYTLIQDSVKSGLLGSLMITKVGGKMAEKPIFFTRKNPKDELELKRQDKKVWQLDIQLIRQQDYFPDPTGEGLYELQRIEMDLWKLIEIAEDNPDIYDVEKVQSMVTFMGEEDQKHEKSRETAQNRTESLFRKRVEIIEAWGTFIGRDGKILHKNSVAAIANGRFLIRKPQPNPFWHGQSPFVVSPIIRVPGSVWHRALMDAVTSLNIAENEIYNLILDSGIMSVFGIKQIREHWMDNADQASDGIRPGFVAKANMQCPPQAKVIERVDTGTISKEALNVLNLTETELQAAALTNDLRQGNFPNRAVKATEVVEASTAITSVFTGIAKVIETNFIEPLLEKSWVTMLQHESDFDEEEVKSIIGDEKAAELKGLSRKEIFAGGVDGFDFKVFGITQTLNKQKEFRKITTLLQTIASSEVLVEEFSRKHDFGKLLVQIMRSLDIDESQIALDEEDAAMESAEQMLAQGEQGLAAGPQDMTQVPQAGGIPEEGGPQIPNEEFAAGESGRTP